MNNQTNKTSTVQQPYTVAFKADPGEWPKIETLLNYLDQLEPAVLVEKYTALVRKFKTRQRPKAAYYIFALMHTFKRVFGKSPILLEDATRLVFGREIFYEHGTFHEADSKKQAFLNNQSRLSSMMRQLNAGQSFDDLDSATKSWWYNRY
jgi:hypothetical protein